MQNKKILIVEDDSFLQGLMSKKLMAEGFEISIALTGTDAVKLLDGGLIPDLIILDILLPGMAGLEFLANLRAREALKTTPVIIFSNFSDEKDIQKAKELGVTEYMIKANFTLDELSAKLKTLIK